MCNLLTSLTFKYPSHAVSQFAFFAIEHYPHSHKLSSSSTRHKRLFPSETIRKMHISCKSLSLMENEEGHQITNYHTASGDQNVRAKHECESVCVCMRAEVGGMLLLPKFLSIH